ncbi:ATP-binding protein [Thalassobaculum sp. OXR-137]|uniref:sensor histidine kinase n=1 Tax=Thalassobaculum sp. OXR-137 TaxID=3100173 RepID=UPI002AC9CCBC|nr:ATP-binding protein [Thalassobaculum sp. OXR-137]WPZ35058.1 ATP-binding protein [Thalassobaculum sp. OXR-137]
MIEASETEDGAVEPNAWSKRAPTLAYAVGLTLVAVIATVIWFTTIFMASTQDQLAAEINVAGRQRMLTQKTALLTASLPSAATQADRADLIAEIAACTDLLERAHRIMLSRDATLLPATAAEGADCLPGRLEPLPGGEMSPDLAAAYFEDPRPVDPLLTRYIELLRSLISLPSQADRRVETLRAEIFEIAHTDLPRRLDRVAQIIQREGEGHLRTLVVTKTLMWVATLVLLVLEVLFIFRPMVRHIERTILSIRTMTFSLAERRRAEQELRLANDAKTRFLAQMSHELRTPLNAIIGYAQMLVSADSLGISQAKRHEYAGDIRASGEHLLDLVTDLLDLSRIETDTVVVNRDIVDIGRVIGGVMAMMRAKSLDRDQHITVTRPDIPVSARIDERLLRQALINLVDNALKYGRDGGRVHISFGQPEQDDVEIVVEDDGIGFDMRDLPMLMEPFARADTDPAVAPDGFGLGLPIARRLIELQDGTLTLRSTPGRGTRARIRIPSVERPYRPAAETEA